MNYLATTLCVLMLLVCSAIDGHGQTADEFLKQGTAYFNQGEYQKAIPVLKKAVALQPDLGDAHYYLGIAYYQKAQYRRATAAFERVVALDPDSAEAYYMLGGLYHRAWILNKAIDYYRNALNRDTRLTDVHFLLAQAYFQQGDYKNAEPYYHSFLKQNPGDGGQVEAARQQLQVIQDRLNKPLPAPPSRDASMTAPAKSIGSQGFSAGFHQTRFLGLHQTDDIPFSPDIYGRYRQQTDYLINFRPYKADNVFLIWKAVVESTRYKHDITAHRLQEAWQYPSYTHQFRQGDCEDSSLLLCDWLRTMGYDAKVVIGNTRDGAHAWVALKDGDDIYFLETALNAKKISRRYLPKLNASIKQYQAKALFDGTNYWRRADGRNLQMSK